MRPVAKHVASNTAVLAVVGAVATLGAELIGIEVATPQAQHDRQGGIDHAIAGLVALNNSCLEQLEESRDACLKQLNAQRAVCIRQIDDCQDELENCHERLRGSNNDDSGIGGGESLAARDPGGNVSDGAEVWGPHERDRGVESEDLP